MACNSGKQFGDFGANRTSSSLSKPFSFPASQEAGMISCGSKRMGYHAKRNIPSRTLSAGVCFRCRGKDGKATELRKVPAAPVSLHPSDTIHHGLGISHGRMGAIGISPAPLLTTRLLFLLAYGGRCSSPRQCLTPFVPCTVHDQHCRTFFPADFLSLESAGSCMPLNCGKPRLASSQA